MRTSNNIRARIEKKKNLNVEVNTQNFQKYFLSTKKAIEIVIPLAIITIISLLSLLLRSSSSSSFLLFLDRTQDKSLTKSSVLSEGLVFSSSQTCISDFHLDFPHMQFVFSLSLSPSRFEGHRRQSFGDVTLWFPESPIQR